MSAQRFYFGKFGFHIRAITDIELPAYKGSTFRGALGHALRRLSCRCEDSDGDVKHTCAYGYLMASSVFHSPKTNAQNPPHSLILEPPISYKRFYASGAELSITAVLIGKAINYLTYVLLAVQNMGQVGIGRGRRGKFVLDYVEAVALNGRESIYSDKEPLLSISPPQITWQGIIEQASSLGDVESIELRFVTPLRLIHGGRLVGCVGIDFSSLINNLIGRISRLRRYYCEADERLNVENLMKIAECVRIADSDLRWHDWERYSTTQQTRMKLGGLLGSVTFTGHLTPFLPYLILGSHIHMGKNTVFGLGKYEINVLA